jgi:hypothetical protein
MTTRPQHRRNLRRPILGEPTANLVALSDDPEGNDSAVVLTRNARSKPAPKELHAEEHGVLQNGCTIPDQRYGFDTLAD